MTKKIFSLIAVACMLSACATPLTPEARMTREINNDWDYQNECKFLGAEQVWSTWKLGAKGNYAEVRNQMRIITTELGGNAFMVGDFSGDGRGHFRGDFEVYYCDEFKK